MRYRSTKFHRTYRSIVIRYQNHHTSRSKSINYKYRSRFNIDSMADFSLVIDDRPQVGVALFPVVPGECLRSNRSACAWPLGSRRDEQRPGRGVSQCLSHSLPKLAASLCLARPARRPALPYNRAARISASMETSMELEPIVRCGCLSGHRHGVRLH